MAKDTDQDWDGLHRYEVAQGFQPRRITITARTGHGALAQMSARMARRPDYVWWSTESEDWQGPPAVWASWAA